MLKKWIAAVVLTASLVVTVPTVSAQEKSAVREGFSAESLNGQKILLFRPSVWVGEQSTAGLPEPNADWTAQARELLNKELSRRQREFRNELVIEPDLVGDEARLFSEHRALFGSVANSVVNYQFFAGNRLPTRKNKPFDWTLGEGTKEIAEKTGARYGLFVNPRDLVTARQFYEEAIATGGAPAEAWRGAGLTAMRGGDNAAGRTALTEYLTRMPTASDAAAMKILLEN